MSLYTSLVGFYKADEASGTRADSTASALTLTDNNTVTSTTGLVYALAAQFTSANSESLSRADNAIHDMGDIDCWGAAWVQIHIKGSDKDVFGKWTTTGTGRAYRLYFLNASDRWRISVSADGVNPVSLNATAAGAPSLDTWYFVLWEYNAATDTLGISVNGGALATASHAGGIFANTTAFRIGANSIVANYFDGLIGPVMLGKNYVPSPTDITYLYNGGAGRTLAAMAAADVVDAIGITTPAQYKVFQRSGSTGSIAITGTYTGTPTAIEASFNGGAYSTIVASPSGGTYSGTLSSQAQGQGTLTVRFTNDTPTAATKTFVGIGDVFLVAGQSNAAGRFTSNQTYTHATLKAAMYREDDLWAELADPTESGGSTGSVWPKLATLFMASQSVPVAFITTAEGGTGLVTPNADWASGGTQYTNALQQVTDSGVNAVKAILWIQGEKDMGNGISQSAYQTALSLMLDNMQAGNAALATTKLVAALPAFQTSVTDAAIDAIRSATINRWDNDSDILAGPPGHDQAFADGLHWTTDGEATTLGNRFWRALLYHFYSGSEQARGPRVASAIRSGAVITVTFMGGVSPLTGQTDVTGWLITDNGTPIAVNSAAASGANKVVLTLASTPSGTVLVNFASGDDGIGATLKDSGTYPLPPEPIVAQAVTAPVVAGHLAVSRMRMALAIGIGI